MVRFIKAFIWIVFYLVAFDVAGMVVNFIVEVLAIDFRFLSYTIWFTFGVLCAFLSYNAAGSKLGKDAEFDWSNSPESGKWGLQVIAMTIGLLVPLTVLFERLFWRGNTSDGRYVPDDFAMTITFFVTIVLAMILAHTVFRPGPPKNQ